MPLKKLKAQDILIGEYNTYLKQCVLFDIDVNVLKRIAPMNPKAIVGKKQLKHGATEELTAEQMLKTTEQQRDGIIKRLNTIQLMLEGKEPLSI